MSILQKVIFAIVGVLLLGLGIVMFYIFRSEIDEETTIYILSLIGATLGGLLIDIIMVQSMVESVTIYDYLERKLGLDSSITKVFTCPKCFGFWSGLVGSIIMSLIFMIGFPFFIFYIATMTWLCSIINYTWYLLMDKVRYGREIDYEKEYEDLIESRRNQYDPKEGARRVAKEAPKKTGCTTCGS